jgi:IS30 family transposase
MPGKWSCKNPLTLQERKLIAEALALDLSYRAMAEYVGRNKSTVMRESKRLGKVEDYDAEEAQDHFECMQRAGRKKMSATLRERKR